MLVEPQVYFIGETVINQNGLDLYLEDSGNTEFQETIRTARLQGLTDGEILCSFYAKVCYAALSLGHNDNLTRIRDIPDNIRNCFDAGHGSVFEHCQLNFIARNVSRVFTHELVRHRVGTAFSQTSGRYVRGNTINLVMDPILEPVRNDIVELIGMIENYYNIMKERIGLDQEKNFDRKKKITSALRRVLPNGQSNEIGFSVNLRSIRHIIQMRTSRGAEWEIRKVFSQVYKLIKEKYKLLFHGATEELIDGELEIKGMKQQPY